MKKIFCLFCVALGALLISVGGIYAACYVYDDCKNLAEQGIAEAQNDLGVMYAEGKGVVQDYREAVKWYKIAAEQGYLGAQFNLALMYDFGRGVAQDSREAFYWYRKAAVQGNASSQYNLGLMYAKGEGIAQDNVQAHMLFNVAAANGHSGARKNRDIVATMMSPEQIAEAQQLAREWMEKFRQ